MRVLCGIRMCQNTCNNIEMIQKRALQYIFPNKGYDDILYDTGMCTLHERRNVICEQYFKNMQGNSHKVHHLKRGTLLYET